MAAEVGYTQATMIIDQLLDNPKWSVERMFTNTLQLQSIIESYLDIEIDLELEISRINKSLKSKGKFLTKTQLCFIKEKIEEVRNLCIANKAWWDYVDLDCAQDLIDRIENNDRKQNHIKIKKVPPKIAYGISLSLSGMFLYCLPFPPAKVAGQRLSEVGILVLLDGIMDMEEKYDNEQEKKKNDGG